MTTAVAIDPEIAHLDHTPNCDCGCHKREPVPATVALNFHSCRVLLRCSDCADTILDNVKYGLAQGLTVVCTKCGTTFTGLDAYVKEVPL